MYSRGEAEGADSDCQGTPRQTRQGVQPHQLGAQSSGQETEEGKGSTRVDALSDDKYVGHMVRSLLRARKIV